MTLLSVQIKKYGGEVLAVMNGRQVSKHLFSILKAGAFLLPENLHFQKMSKVVCHAATMVLQGVPVRQYGKIPHSTEIALWIIPLSTKEKSSGRSLLFLLLFGALLRKDFQHTMNHHPVISGISHRTVRDKL